MKILHTADLHLDSAFCLSSPSEAAARRTAQREVLKNIFSLAKGEACDMILISGDLFDTVCVMPETRALCLELFEEFKKPIVIAPGNHDPYVSGSFYKETQMPENVNIFTSNELQFLDFYEQEITVAGYAFTSAAMPKSPLSGDIPVRHNQRILLLCAHADVNVPTSRYAPVLSSTLSRLGFDYCAMGHVHKHTDLSGGIVYCGIPEGRSFDECGEGGVMLVTLDGVSEPHIERRIISTRQYEWHELSLEGARSAEEVLLATNKFIERYKDKSGVHLRLELVGTVSEDAAAAIKLAGSQVYPNLQSVQIIDSTLTLPDGEALKDDRTLRGEFYRSLIPKLYSEDAEQRATAIKALSIGLAAIDGKEIL